MRSGGGTFEAMAKPSSRSQKSLKDALIQKESPNTTPHVVIVMDALREFSIDPLRWALENIIPAGCVVTLLGIMPWLNIPCEYAFSIFPIFFLLNF